MRILGFTTWMARETAQWYPNQIPLTTRIMMQENAPLSVVVKGNLCHDRLYSMRADEEKEGASHGP